MSLFKKNDGKTEHLWVEERLSAYLDDELSSQERDAVEHHLARCQDCQWNLRTLRQTVQWTKALPTVPVPRVFTIPAPAEKPVRARRRSWGMGLLQGATALVALLLVFAVAGDFVLTGLVPRQSDAPIVMKEQAVVDSAATEVAQEEAPQAMKAVGVAPTDETETGAARYAAGASPEGAMEAQPTPAPEGTSAPAAASEAPMMQALPAEPEGTDGPTSEPEASALGAAPFESPLEATQEAAGGGAAGEAPRVAAAPATEPAAAAGTEEPLAAAAAASGPAAGAPATESAGDAQAAMTTTAAPGAEERQAYAKSTVGEPAGTVPPSAAADQEPTIVAAAPALAPQADQERAGEQEQIRGAARDRFIPWVQTAEIVLGGAFVILASATIALMLRRRRAG